MSNLRSLFNLKNSIILAGVLGVVFFVVFTNSKPETNEHYESYEFAEYTVNHPFPVDSTNLLPGLMKSDNDLQSRLNKYDVRAAIDSVFVEQKFNLVKDTFLTFGSLSFPISGYDTERRIGYVWIDYDRFGEGILDKKLGRSKTQKEGETDFLKSIDDGLELYFDDEETFLDDVFGSDDIVEDEKNRERILAEWRQAMDSMSRGEVKFEDIREKYTAYQSVMTTQSTILNNWEFFGNTLDRKSDFVRTYGDEVRGQLQSIKSHESQKEYLEIILKEFRKTLEVNYLSAKQNKSMLDEWKLSAANMIKDPQRFFGFTSLIDQIRMYSPNSKLLHVLDDQVFQIDMYSSSKDWWNHSLAIIELFNVNKNPGLYNKDRYQTLLSDIMTSDKYAKWNKRYHEIEALANLEVLSLDELKSISGLAFQEGICIAPISILDNRMIYDMEEEAYLEKLSALRAKYKSSKSKKVKKDIQEKIMKHSVYRAENYGYIRKKAKEKSILRLQNDIRKFINWAEVQTQQISFNN